MLSVLLFSVSQFIGKKNTTPPLPPPPTPLSSRCVGFTCPCQLELKKTLLDRMVHLLSRGYVLPVVGYIRKCLEKLNTDISLIRYFVTEVRSAPDVRR